MMMGVRLKCCLIFKMTEQIQFFAHDIDFTPPHVPALKEWIAWIVRQNKRSIEAINFIFSSDAYVLSLNQQHLDHNYYTDILTFSFSPPTTLQLMADIYISVERVQDNARKFNTTFEDELHRVMIHGVLHLLGYEDHTPEEQQFMREQERLALSLRKFL